MPALQESRWIDMLEEEDLAFMKRFILLSGSLKELADAYHVSYPTLRLRLDRLIEKIKILDNQKVEDTYERLLRAQFADGKLDATTFKHLLSAYERQKKEYRMKTISVTSLLLVLATSCFAQQTLTEYDWRKLADSGQLLGGEVVTVDGQAALKIANTNDMPLQVQILKIVKPPITKTLYGIVGQVKYEGVRGTGYLEMWNYYPPLKPGMLEGAYFSRTLGNSGEMGKITGTSNWRGFVLPFDRSGANGPPTRLEVNVFLPGPGTVYLSQAKLMEYNGSLADAVNYTPGAWWSGATAGWIGGIGGSLFGCLAGLLAWLASNGKLRPFVLATSVTLIVIGAILIVAGFVALALKQPYAV